MTNTMNFIALLAASMTLLMMAQRAMAATVNDTSDLPKISNIGFLGRGYDIIKANPRPLYQPIDAGFVSSIFDMTSYRQNRITADGRHAVPDYSDVIECTACQLSFESFVISGPQSYKESLQGHVRPESGFEFNGATQTYSYRASEAYLRVNDETLNKRRVLIDTSASCVVYCAELRLPLKPPILDTAFVEAVKLLPLINGTADKTPAKLQVYFAFLQKFGTHFVSSMRAGSLFWQRATFNAQNYTRVELETSNIGIDIAAGLTFLASTFDYQSQQEKEVAERFRRSASSIILYSVGALPLSRQGPYNTTLRWLQESKEYPMPIDFRLIPIQILFQNDSLLGESVESLEMKRAIIDDLIQNGTYCEYLATFNSKIQCGFELFDSLSGQNQKPKIPSNFGGIYFKANMPGLADIPNQFTGIFDCPAGFTSSIVGGGQYFVDSWPGGNCYPDGSYTPINKQIALSPTLPGFLYLCSNGSADQQSTFFGLFTLVNAQGYGMFQHWQCSLNDTCCGGICRKPGSTGRDCRDRALRGEYDILVAFYGCEYVFASFSRSRPDSLIGGFYLVDKTRPTLSWINPATGVTSCPAGYIAKLLFSQTLLSPAVNIFPFESYICLLETSLAVLK